MQNQEERRRITRKAILSEATRIIIDRGLQACSIAEIAKGASFTTGAIQHHFKSKDHLLKAVVTEHIFDKNDLEHDETETQLTLEIRCKRVVKAMWAYYGGNDYFVVWEIMLGVRNNEKLWCEITEFFKSAESKLEFNIQDYFYDLSLTSSQARDAAIFVSSHLRGLSLLRLSYPNNTEISSQPDYLADLLHMKMQDILQSNMSQPL
ncbi:MAG: AcrR family transcriptional regulator [Pseudohongiellaceae bacterium]|jgi:AcrR family transcriptional regulator